ncbi:MAG: GGDEF domain-containing protein [Deltaproteobacteria bacterium]|nr:GGDEF domain-containing protein [Deltaproteobacteria bacterium]
MSDHEEPTVTHPRPPEGGPTAEPLSVALLAEFVMLEGVSLTARNDLIESARVRELAKGETLLRAGEPNEQMFLVLGGHLGVFLEGHEGEAVAMLGVGETVGELSLLDGSPVSATVIATETTRLLAIDEATFWRLTDASHAFAVNLLMRLAARLRANNAAVSKSVVERRRYERAAMFDGLTGIHNRRWLDETLHRLVKRQRLSGGHLSVALIDIDHFKQFNDRFGHAAGDHVLSTVASLLARNLRPTDLVARFGGEEFVILFPDTLIDDAVTAAERVRLAAAAERLKMPDGTDLPPVTISVGVAELGPSHDVTELLKIADLAMYSAKQSGRNRVVRASP